MKLTLYQQIVQTRCGKPADEEKKLIGYLCEKYQDVPYRKNRLHCILNDLNENSYDFIDPEATEKARYRIRLAIKQYRNHCNSYCMDRIEKGLDRFIREFYLVTPEKDIYLFVYFLIIRKYQYKEITDEMTDVEDIAVSCLTDALLENREKRLILSVSRLSRQDRILYSEFRKRNGLVFSSFSFLDRKYILTEHFCKMLKNHIVEKKGKDAERWIIDFTS